MSVTVERTGSSAGLFFLACDLQRMERASRVGSLEPDCSLAAAGVAGGSLGLLEEVRVDLHCCVSLADLNSYTVLNHQRHQSWPVDEDHARWNILGISHSV